jgi:hypothetical protein
MGSVKTSPGSTTLERFERIQTQFVVLVVLAVGAWFGQDFVASFAARQMMARTDLWTPDKWDDARVQRAFQEARRATRLEVTLERNANGFHPERHDYLAVIAPTKREAIEGRRAHPRGLCRGRTGPLE